MKQIAKALGYFLLYFVGGQIIFAFIIQYCMGLYAGGIARSEGTVFSSIEEAQAYGINFYQNNMGIDLAGRAIVLLLLLLVIFLIKKKNFAKETCMQMTTGKKWLAAVLGAVFVIFFVNGMVGLLTPSNQLESFEQASSVLYAYPLWQAILANALLVPIVEEVFFRGLIFSRLQKVLPNIATALITSAIFGLVHGQLLWMLFAFIVGLVLSFVRIKSGSILPTILMHVMINTYATVVSYGILNITSEVVMIALMVLGLASIVGCVFLMNKACKEETDAKVEVSTVVL